MTPILLAITGASGAILGIRALQLLHEAGVETHLIISRAAQATIQQETSWKIEGVKALAKVNYSANNLGAPPASGSFVTRGMLIIPCSIKTLSAVANSYSNNLISRAADVCLKEGRPLLLAVREAPFHFGHLRLMEQAAQNGAIIFPPIPAFYGSPKSLEELIDDMVGRMLLRVGIENSAYKEWKGMEAES